MRPTSVPLAGARPSFLAVPSCCAAPLAGFLGAGALAPLLLATPWVLAVTTGFLLAQTIDLARRYRRIRRVRGGP